jgi:large subunit ribosomal protein L22
VDEARVVLEFTNRKAAGTIIKVLDSAVANAEHNFALDADELYVAEAYADEGPTLKRWRPRARGRATKIRKRTSHITIIVAETEEVA